MSFFSAIAWSARCSRMVRMASRRIAHAPAATALHVRQHGPARPGPACRNVARVQMRRAATARPAGAADAIRSAAAVTLTTSARQPTNQPRQPTSAGNGQRRRRRNGRGYGAATPHHIGEPVVEAPFDRGPRALCVLQRDLPSPPRPPQLQGGPPSLAPAEPARAEEGVLEYSRRAGGRGSTRVLTAGGVLTAGRAEEGVLEYSRRGGRAEGPTARGGAEQRGPTLVAVRSAVSLSTASCASCASWRKTAMYAAASASARSSASADVRCSASCASCSLACASFSCAPPTKAAKSIG